MDVLDEFPVRKSVKEKTAFIEAVMKYAGELGYSTKLETEKRGVRNIVIGNLGKAKYLITAHYDTPASIGLPNFIVPNNPVAYFGFQLALVSLLLGVAIGVGFAIHHFSADQRLSFLGGYFVYFAILILMLKGPANKSNANDNTSGVVTALEILSALPDELRENVCCVLFDMEEAGLVGSAQFRKKHKAATENQIVLNLDCVGDGDVIQLTPVKKARKDEILLSALAKICVPKGEKELRLRSKGFYGGSSDHKNFPFGVAIMAFHYQKGLGLYCGRIHTWRDKILDDRNVLILRDALISFIAEHSGNSIEILK
jgi:hypothetical protein